MSFSSFKDLREEKSVFSVLGLAVRDVAAAEKWDLPGFLEPDVEPTLSFATPDVPILGILDISNFVAFVDDRGLVTIFGNRVHFVNNLLQVILCISSPVPQVFALQVVDNSLANNSLLVIGTSLSLWNCPIALFGLWLTFLLSRKDWWNEFLLCNWSGRVSFATCSDLAT